MSAVPPVLVTERLRLRPITLSDDAFVLALLNTPGWLRFIGDKQVHDAAAARRYVEAGPLAMYARHGLGLMVIERRADHVPLGMAGLIRRDGLVDPDIGYALLPEHEGQGVASEAAAAFIADARTRLQLPALCAITDPDNTASMRLLERLGFVFARMVHLATDKPAVRLFRLPLGP